MHLDLFTLLLVRLCLEVFLVAFYLSFARRHARMGGPGWWAAAALASALSSLAVVSSMFGAQSWMVLYVAVGFTAMSVSHACVWLGLRSYQGLPSKGAVGWLIAGGLVMLLTQAAMVAFGDNPVARRVLFLATSWAMVALSLFSLPRRVKTGSVSEFRGVRGLFVLQLLVYGIFLGRLVYMLATEKAMPAGWNDGAPYVMLFFVMEALVRTALLSALVAHRLQQDQAWVRQRLQDGQADLRALLDNIHAGVVVLNPDRSVETINAAARRFLEGGGEHLADLDPHRVWLCEDGRPMARHDLPFERVLATGLPLSDVLLGVRTGDSGELRWAVCNAFADNDAMGGLRHVVLTFMDITSLQAAQREQKQLQTQLAQSQKMKALGTLAGGVAHDFNNILAAILGNADLARHDLPPGTPARQSLHEISAAARRGRELVRQILAFSRQQPMERQRVSMRTILRENAALLKSAVPPQAQLVYQCGPGDLTVSADPTQLGQVLLNLGTNALHALAGQAGRVEIRADRLAEGWPDVASGLSHQGFGVIRLQVQDSGCGMDEVTRQRIFEPFFTTRSTGTGTGLGLPVVLGIVQSHGGAIEVHSEPGAGSIFSLYFPAESADKDKDLVGGDGCDDVAAADAIEHEISDSNTSLPATSVQNEDMTTDQQTPNSHILYLDDDDTLVFLVRRLLERRGYTVTALADQHEAIEAVRANPQAFDLLMTDFNMPGMSGLDVARAVLAINPALPVAVASGYITDELQAEALAAGVREVVFKTDAVEDFCAVVAKLVS